MGRLAKVSTACRRPVRNSVTRFSAVSKRIKDAPARMPRLSAVSLSMADATKKTDCMFINCLKINEDVRGVYDCRDVGVEGS